LLELLLVADGFVELVIILVNQTVGLVATINAAIVTKVTKGSYRHFNLSKGRSTQDVFLTGNGTTFADFFTGQF
jgi:hypothetical protein